MNHRTPAYTTSMKHLSALCTLLLLPLTATATTTYTNTWNVSTVIPDNDPVGFTSSQTIAPGITSIDSVVVNLDFTGGWNGDLYAYLVSSNGGYAVLLNRPGVSATTPDGAGSSGMNVTIADSATYAIYDIHTAIPMSGGQVTGTFQPDGRTTDPQTVLNTDSRTAMLSSFDGKSANGTWTLFVADMSPGFTSTLQSWSLTVTSVPEPSSCLLGAFGLVPLFLRRRV